MDMTRRWRRSADFWVGIGLAAVLLTGLGLRLRDINTPLVDTFASREIYDAYVARAFYRHGYTLLNPPIVKGLGYGVLDNQFELYPLVVAVGYAIAGGEHVIIGRMIGVVCALLSIWLLYEIGAFCGDRLLGLFAGLFLAISPIQVAFSREFLAESFLTFLYLFAVYEFFIWTRRGRTWAYVASLTAMTLAVLVKIFPVAFLGALLLYGLVSFRRTLRTWGLLAVYAVVPNAAGLYWYLVKTDWVRDVEVERYHFSNIRHIPEYIFHGYPWRVPVNPLWFGFFALLGFVWLVRRGRQGLPVATMVVATLGYYVIVCSHMSAHPYYMMHVVPGGALLAAAGLSLVTRAIWSRAERLEPSAQRRWRACVAGGLIAGVALTAWHDLPLVNEFYGQPVGNYPRIAEIVRRLHLLAPSTRIIAMDDDVSSILPNYYFDRPGYLLTGQHMPIAVRELEDDRAHLHPKPDYFVAAINDLLPADRFRSFGFASYLEQHYAPVYLNNDFVVYDIRQPTTPDRSVFVSYDLTGPDWDKNLYYSQNASHYPPQGTGYVFSPGGVSKDTQLVYRLEFPRPLQHAFLRIDGRAYPGGGILQPYVSLDGRDFVQVGTNVVDSGDVYDIAPAIGDSRTAYLMLRVRGGEGWTILKSFTLSEVFRDGTGQLPPAMTTR